MYEVSSSMKKIDGISVMTWKREVYSCNALAVEAGTTGLKGGDSGHGCRTYFSIRDEGCTDMEVHTVEDKYGRQHGFEVQLGGDSELQTTIEALEFIIQVLKGQIAEAETYGI